MKYECCQAARMAKTRYANAAEKIIVIAAEKIIVIAAEKIIVIAVKSICGLRKNSSATTREGIRHRKIMLVLTF